MCRCTIAYTPFWRVIAGQQKLILAYYEKLTHQVCAASAIPNGKIHREPSSMAVLLNES